jgi:phosphoglucosamine mutase
VAASASRPRFGTDGVRGVANTQLTNDHALALGRAAARVLGSLEFVVGRDTRRSSRMLEAAFVAGLASEGARVELLGDVPTPAVAFVGQQRGIAGAMISASHNPFADNGIKLFASGGRKLADDVEHAIDDELDRLGPPTRTGADVGDIADGAADVDGYFSHLHDALGGRWLRGQKVVVDAANGAASRFASAVFARAGADVVAIADQPDGVNINDHCGATHPDALAAAVVAHGAALGLALDGDADRLIAVDHTGAIVDGDHVMAVLALDLKGRGALRDDNVVVTVMTNLGFRLAMGDHGVNVVETPVGDRYVLAALDAGNYSLGGEQSGHVILRDLATTGDGLLTGLLLADAVVRSERSLAELAGVMRRLPQVLINVRLVERRAGLLDDIAGDVAAAERALDGRGRILIRPSGTEPLVRVMVEAPTHEQAGAVARSLAALVERLA